ncbi:hypothetical protein [Paenibacillus agricola]|uniref:Uncharacterized protein n=1 Tax=Paenibacillus agricola TaxID=2716264 RepID=A0ABX0JEX0_9BACL|nr:hypothetical protein [Paenibacillus agricola]NHN33940.1 hypothetical protein [Paenibacillus agricola]
MQMISWSADLHATVKNLKKLDPSALQARLNDRNFMNSLALSASEEQALASSFQYKNNNEIKADWG